jgi:hypothetical protein
MFGKIYAIPRANLFAHMVRLEGRGPVHDRYKRQSSPVHREYRLNRDNDRIRVLNLPKVIVLFDGDLIMDQRRSNLGDADVIIQMQS